MIPSPGCVDWIVQLPSASSVAVAAAELTWQIDGVVDANPTVSPELAVAESVSGDAELMVCAPICVKLMICGSSVTAKLCETLEAEAYTEFPGWLAAMVHVPA